MNNRQILKPLIFIVVATLIVVLVFSYSRRPYLLSSDRVLIPETNVSVQIPSDFLYNSSGLFIFEDPYETFATPVTLQKLLLIQPMIPDPYRGYQPPERVLENFFKKDVPEMEVIHEFEVYLQRVDRESLPETLTIKGLILYGDEQYISLDFHGPSSEATQLNALLDAVLNSMQVEEK